MDNLAVGIGLQAANDDPRFGDVKEDDALELQRLDDAAQNHGEDVVDLERRVNRRKDLLENEKLGVALGVFVALGLDGSQPRAQLLEPHLKGCKLDGTARRVSLHFLKLTSNLPRVIRDTV